MRILTHKIIYMISFVRLLSIGVLLSLLLTTCARNNIFNEPPDYPVIDSIAPASGKTGTQIRLYGTGFSNFFQEDSVSVNGVRVRVDSPSTSTVVLATITSVTGTGAVNITVHNKEAKGPIFTYDEHAVSLNSLSPSSGWVDTVVTLRGAGFGTHPDSVTVSFNGHPAAIQKFSDSLIVVVAPDATNQAPATVTVLVTVSGRPSNGLPFVYTHPTAVSGGLYILGVTTAQTIAYWKDGVPTVLTDCASATSISASNKDVYIVGTGRDGVAHYYKNGVSMNITDATSLSPGGIFVSGTDVYVSGTILNSTHKVAAYWKNGVQVNLTDGTRDVTAIDIFVAGNDVYVEGVEANPSNGAGANNTILCYWKNGVRVNCTDGTQEVIPDYGTSLFVSGTDVYIAGYYNYTSASQISAAYWKNGSRVDLTSVPGYAFGAGAFVSGPDLYVSGELAYFKSPPGTGAIAEAVYWKNGVITHLTDSADGSSVAKSVYVSGTDVYLPGVKGAAHGGGGYWKNGAFISLPACETAIKMVIVQ